MTQHACTHQSWSSSCTPRSSQYSTVTDTCTPVPSLCTVYTHPWLTHTEKQTDSSTAINAKKSTPAVHYFSQDVAGQEGGQFRCYCMNTPSLHRPQTSRAAIHSMMAYGFGRPRYLPCGSRLIVKSSCSM